MRHLEYIEYTGVTLAGIGFACLSTGFLFTGFMLGVLSCGFLIPYFGNTKQKGLFSLQLYFLVFNILGVINNG